jgi:hypothetical protein
MTRHPVDCVCDPETTHLTTRHALGDFAPRARALRPEAKLSNTSKISRHNRHIGSTRLAEFAQ